MTSRLLSALVAGAGGEAGGGAARGKAAALQELLTSVKNCQCRFGGKSELATEDDIRIVQLCEKWEAVLSNRIRTPPSTSSIQGIVAAGLSFTFNVNTVGHSLWSYVGLHLTKHERERFTMLKNVNSPLGYFRAFLRAALNERLLERYLESWLSHGLLFEYYEEGALCRDPEISNLLPSMAAGLSSILFALSIDKAELNEAQQQPQVQESEHVIPLPAPIKTNTNVRKKPLRQVISFDKNEQQAESMKTTKERRKSQSKLKESWSSAPSTCLNSPDPKLINPTSSNSEPATSDFKNIRQFFPDTTKITDSPSQILSKLTERAKEIFSSSHSVDLNSAKDDLSDLSICNLRISESDSEEMANHSINGSVSCLELCFADDEAGPEEHALRTAAARHEREYLALQIKHSQMELANREKIKKLENVILDSSKENERLKEQLRQYMSAVEMGLALKKGGSDNEEINQYEKKLVQVAEMHAELMEFNQHLQKRLQEAEKISSLDVLSNDIPVSNVKVYIPAAFLVGQKTHSYHVYQIFVKVHEEEWNVYHRYAKFRELHMQLRKCHQDIATFKFPPKKALGKKEAWLVEARRAALQAYLRHVLLVVPELRACSSRAQLLALVPFFGASSSSTDSNGRNRLTRLFTSGSQASVTSTNSYAAL